MSVALTHEEAYEKCKDRTMFEESRWETLRSIVDAGIPDGAIVELGCHRAGLAAYLALRTGRPILAADRFEDGCTFPVEKDGHTHLEGGIMGSDMQETRRWLREVEAEAVTLLKADLACVMYTFDHPIALAIVDLNLYEPTANCLRMILPSLADGGTIIVDDVSYPGVRAALDECGTPYENQGHMAIIRKG